MTSPIARAVTLLLTLSLLLLLPSTQSFFVGRITTPTTTVAPSRPSLSFTTNSPLPSQQHRHGLAPLSSLSSSSVSDSLDVVLSQVTSHMDSSSLVLSGVTGDEVQDLTKTVVIVLAFGGGLIPALFSANSAMIKTLSGKRASSSLYISSSDASGPSLPFAPLLLAPAPIPLSDVIAIIGRISDLNSIADWRNLPTTKLPGVSETNPPMWLPREMFKETIRNAKFTSWPVDPNTGEPVGGTALKDAELKRVSRKGVIIGDPALDAVFDSWAGGASVATPDKVAVQLEDWRSDGSMFDLGRFVGAAVRGRASTVVAALTFVVIQVIVFGTLFVGPALRQFADFDIGFGELGDCDGVCRTFADLF